MFEQLRANVRKLRDNLASLETQQADTEDEGKLCHERITISQSEDII